MKYVSPEYQAQLDALAETLCNPERFKKIGQLALFTPDEPRTVEAWHDPFIDDLSGYAEADVNHIVRGAE